MKSRIAFLFKFETLIVVLILAAYSLLWIDWGKMNVYGWDLPALYRKMTKTTNTVLFFAKKESPYLAYSVYIVPALGLLSLYLRFRLKQRVARFTFLLTCILGVAVSLYMYYYFISSKIFKLANAGAGIHLLCVVSVVGILYLLIRPLAKASTADTEPICDAGSIADETKLPD